MPDFLFSPCPYDIINSEFPPNFKKGCGAHGVARRDFLEDFREDWIDNCLHYIPSFDFAINNGKCFEREE
jgi:hypothetical protein